MIHIFLFVVRVFTQVCRVVQIIQQAWPFIGQYLEKLLVETVAPAIRASSIHLQTLSFTKVNIGDKVRACTSSAARKKMCCQQQKGANLVT